VQWLLYLARFDFVLYYCLSKFIDKLDVLYQRPDHDNSLCDNKYVVLLKPEYLVVCVLEGLAFEEEKCSLLINIC